MAERKQPAQKRASKTQILTIRISADDRATIERLASENDMTMTQYVTDAALDRLHEVTDSVDTRLEQVFERLTRLETLAFGTE